jgi:hypothetical protein
VATLLTALGVETIKDRSPILHLGVGPDLGGALALLTTAGKLQVEDVPTLESERGGKRKRQADVRALADLIRAIDPSHAVIERIGAMPRRGVDVRLRPLTGQIEGVIGGLAVPVTYIWSLTGVVPSTCRRARLAAGCGRASCCPSIASDGALRSTTAGPTARCSRCGN